MFIADHHNFSPSPEKIWLATPTMHGPELTYMTEAFDANWMSTVGQNINEIEAAISQKLGANYAVALSCGTDALHMAVKLSGVKPGDKVFCSDMTFTATVNPVVYEGGIPVLIDTEYDTWNMDPEALEKAFSLYPEVKVVIVAHLYGTPAKIDQIRSVAEKHGAIVIEDAAESLGATYRGQQTGSLGNIGVISFNGNKIITGSSGGMLLTNDETAANQVRKWASQARENAPWYEHTQLGYNYCISNVVAGVIRGQLPYLEEHIARKKEIYERYREGLKGLPVSMNPMDLTNSQPNYWLSCMLIHPDGMCHQIREGAKASYVPEHGKSCPAEILDTLQLYNAEGRPIWKPMHMQPLYKNHAFVSRKNGTDVSADIFHRGLCLPSDIKMTPQQQDQVIACIRACFE